MAIANSLPRMRTLIKGVVDTLAPHLGRLYRQLRDERRQSQPSRPTAFGISLAGDASLKSGDFEKEELELFVELMTISAVCVDVGAHIGLYSCVAAKYGKHVVAVEPLQSNLSLLYRNLVTNGFLDVEVYPVGLASKAGLRQLFGGGTGASLIEGWAGTAKEWRRMVPITLLDTIAGMRFMGSQLIIKMDVEGSELEVLKGAQRTLAINPKPYWLVEIMLSENHPAGRNTSFQEIFEIFWGNGYEARTANLTRRLIARDDVTRWLRTGLVDFGSHNYLFVHSGD